MFARSLVSAARAAWLEDEARRMRFAPTASEHLLWLQLSGSKSGFGFRRQLVIGNFIVDLACTKVRLVVEIDGGAHHGREQKDAQRARKLVALGWRVVRFEEHEVCANVEAVVLRIRTACLDTCRGTGGP